MRSDLQVGHSVVALPAVAVGIWRDRSGVRALEHGDPARVPVCPVDGLAFDVQVHGVDANIGVTLEGLLKNPVSVFEVQAADFVVVGYVQDLFFST